MLVNCSEFPTRTIKSISYFVSKVATKNNYIINDILHYMKCISYADARI